MIRRELSGASREMAVDPSVMQDRLINMLGVGWPNGASAPTGQQDSSHKVDVDSELMTSPPPPPNVHICTLPLLGRVQVINILVCGFVERITMVKANCNSDEWYGNRGSVLFSVPVDG